MCVASQKQNKNIQVFTLYVSIVYNSLIVYVSNGNLLLQMDDEEVKFEVHYGGTFLWNPSLEYFGGKVKIMYKDSNRLSYFEIEGICEALGIDEPSKVHYLAP